MIMQLKFENSKIKSPTVKTPIEQSLDFLSDLRDQAYQNSNIDLAVKLNACLVAITDLQDDLEDALSESEGWS